MKKSQLILKTSFIWFVLLILPLFLYSFLIADEKSRATAKQSEPTGQKLPNIVLVIVDQFRADASKREGFKLNTTPFLDSLAQTGTWFNKAYCASPACVPSRTSMFTGRFPNATHVRSNMNVEDAFFKEDLIGVLKSKNYSTALVGKNHSYLRPKMFDYWKEYSHLDELQTTDPAELAVNKYLHGTNFYMDKNPAPFPASLQQPARIVEDGENWITGQQAKEKGKPFFLYMSIPEPHNPYQVSEPYYSMFPPESLPSFKADASVLPAKGNKWVLHNKMSEMGYPGYIKNIPRLRSNYYGMMRLIDDQMRSFIGYLQKHDLYENTVFIFVADHGDFTGQYGLIKKGVEVPECLVRIPMIWHGPGISKNRQPHTAHVSNADIMPTICTLLNVPIPEGVQGRSLWPLLTGQSYPKEEFSSILVQQGYGGRHYTDLEEYNPYNQDGTLEKGETKYDELNTWTQSGMMRMLRKGDWKLVYDMQGNGQLYHLTDDPEELKNLFDNKKYLQKQDELLKDLMAWELRLQDPLPLPRPNKERHYGFKTDPYNYWAPYKNEPAEKLKMNMRANRRESNLK